MFEEAIDRLIRGEDLSADETEDAMGFIMSGEASPVQIAAYLTALRAKGETSEEILGSARAMRDKVIRVDHHQARLFDNCGTGGDGAGTFNISTTSAFVLAGCGLALGKHGNRCVSSRCGSADLLQALGASIDLAPAEVGKCIDQIGIGFLFAPLLHPAMKEVAPVRKALGFRTIFNILGPLTNPAFATHQLIGVFDAKYTETMALVARDLGIENILVVFNLEGLDEVTTAGTNRISTVSNGRVETFFVEPEDYGFERTSVDLLKGGEAEENAEITRRILSGGSGPGRDTVVLNSALGLVAAGAAGSIGDGIDLAAACIDAGKALGKLEDFVNFTNGLKHAD